MNKKILFVLPLGWMLVGCVTGPSPRLAVCEEYTGPIETCTGDKNDPKTTVDLDALTVDPECLNAKKGRVIVFKLKSDSKIKAGSVEVFPKDPADWWLTGNNRPNKKRIIVLVPEGIDVESEPRDYGIRTKTKCIDPRVNVQN